MRTIHVVIDIGGTSTRIGLSVDQKKLDDIVRFDTPLSLKELRSQISQTLDSKTSINEIDTLRIGIAGIVNHKTNQVLHAANIPYLSGIGIEQIIPSTKAKTSLYNDTELAALGEYHFGNWDNNVKPEAMAYITISTGVGGSRVIHGKLDNTTYNSEPGHMVINSDGTEKEKSGLVGTFEAYSSGTSFKLINGLSSLETENPKIWLSYANNLAYGLSNIVLAWTPDIIVLGGGMANSHCLFLENTLKKIKTVLPPHYPIPEIKISQLGDKNGLLGGLVV